MKFNLEAYLGIGEKRYRLQQDNTWKNIGRALTRNSDGFDHLDQRCETDKFFERLQEIRSYTKITEIEIEGTIYKVNMRGGSIGDLNDYMISMNLHPKVVREEMPHRFSAAEVQKAIEEGDDSYHNSPVVDLNGRVQLMQLSDARRTLAPIAVRVESFMAGNGYVGRKEALDTRLAYSTYRALLIGWVAHLHNDELDNYVECDYSACSEFEMWKKVDELTQHLVKPKH